MNNLKTSRINKIKKVYWRFSSIVPIVLEEEFNYYKKYCKGIILNVGSGSRKLDLGPYQLLTDIDLSFPVHFASDAHFIPFQDNTIDTIINIAVLEHTKYPWKVVEEFYRVLKPGAHAIVAVPFLQPEHNMPYDYYRFTYNGIIELFNLNKFEIVEINKLVNNLRIFSWLFIENIKSLPRIIRTFLLPLCHIMSRFGNDLGKKNHTAYRGVYLVAKKPGSLQIELPKTLSIDWYFQYLCCPITKKKLKRVGELLKTEGGSKSYPLIDERPVLMPGPVACPK